MSETKHTPGPWEIWDRTPNSPIINSPNTQICTCSFTETRGVVNTQEEVMANACLIAAAPDLLEACQWALDNMKGSSGDHQRLQFAIAKATKD